MVISNVEGRSLVMTKTRSRDLASQRLTVINRRNGIPNAQTIPIISLSLPQEDTKGSSFMDTKKEELIKAIKQAMQHKEEARKKTAEEWKREGIKGKVILI